MASTEKIGTWEHVITDAGHHLRLKGGNGEIVLYSEVYVDPRSIENALSLVHSTCLTNAFNGGGFRTEVFDERTKQ